MTFARLADEFPDHPKVDRLSDAAFRLHVAGMCHCARFQTDGVIDAGRVARLVARYKPSLAAELVASGVWEPHADGWVVHDYLDWNPSAAEVRKVQEARAAAGSKGGSKRSSKRLASATANGEAGAQQTLKPKSSTNHKPLESSTNSLADDAQESRPRRLARAHWEATDPKPAVKFIALMKILERFTEAGWSDEQILDALAETRAYTVDSIEFSLRQESKRAASDEETAASMMGDDWMDRSTGKMP